MKQYTIFFLGKPKGKVSEHELRQNLMKLFKVSEEAIEKLFIGKPVIIKKNLTKDKAKSYYRALENAGAKASIKKEKSGKSEEKTSITKAKKPTDKNQLSSGLSQLTNYNSSLTEELSHKNETKTVNENLNGSETTNKISMLPPDTGSLEEFSVAKTHANIPDTSYIEMGNIEEGTLEEFSHHQPEIDLPDISQLSISSDDKLQTDKPKIKVKVPQLKKASKLTMSEVNSGSLEEFVTKKESKPIPNISHIQMVD